MFSATSGGSVGSAFVGEGWIDPTPAAVTAAPTAIVVRPNEAPVATESSDCTGTGGRCKIPSLFGVGGNSLLGGAESVSTTSTLGLLLPGLLDLDGVCGGPLGPRGGGILADLGRGAGLRRPLTGTLTCFLATFALVCECGLAVCFTGVSNSWRI